MREISICACILLASSICGIHTPIYVQYLCWFILILYLTLHEQSFYIHIAYYSSIPIFWYCYTLSYDVVAHRFRLVGTSYLCTFIFLTFVQKEKQRASCTLILRVSAGDTLPLYWDTRTHLCGLGHHTTVVSLFSSNLIKDSEAIANMADLSDEVSKRLGKQEQLLKEQE